MCLYVCLCVVQVFGVDEQEPVCVSRFGVTDQRERITSQRSGTGERGKPGRMETEVQKDVFYSNTHNLILSLVLRFFYIGDF